MIIQPRHKEFRFIQEALGQFLCMVEIQRRIKELTCMQITAEEVMICFWR